MLVISVLVIEHELDVAKARGLAWHARARRYAKISAAENWTSRKAWPFHIAAACRPRKVPESIHDREARWPDMNLNGHVRTVAYLEGGEDSGRDAQAG
jgi:hypothetical protein